MSQSKSTTIPSPGGRAFAVASFLTIVIAIGHTSALLNDPPNDQWEEAIESMRNASIEFGPVSFSLYATFEGEWVQVGALLVMIGVSNLLVLTAIPEPLRRRVVRVLSLYWAACFGLLSVLFAYYMIPPPLISFVLLTFSFLFAACRARPRAIAENAS